jgi:Mrp family chromosome partitioning ATPase
MRELEREAQASRAAFEAFLDRSRKMREQPEIDTTHTVVISPAMPPLESNGIPPILLVLVAGVVGLNLGGLAAVARDRSGGFEFPALIAKARWRTNTKKLRVMKSHAGLSVLAVLPQPSVESFGGNRSGGSDSPFVADFPPEAKAVGASKAIYELYDRLRAAGPRGTPHVLLVTSLDEEIGKSCVALGIALASTCRGEKVLLVDGDPNAVLSHAVGRPSALAFEDVLTLHVPLTAAILKLAPANVAMLNNKTSDKARPVLSRSTVHEMLIAPSSQYDLIVIDGGIAGANPSSPALAGAATNAIVVTSEKSARGNAMTKLRSALGPDAEKVVGAVVMVGK